MTKKFTWGLDMSPLGNYIKHIHVMERVTTRAYPDLKTWRDAKRFNQRQAAKLLGISQTYYGRLERREQLAIGKCAKRITELTGVPLEILVGAA